MGWAARVALGDLYSPFHGKAMLWITVQPFSGPSTANLLQKTKHHPKKNDPNRKFGDFLLYSVYLSCIYIGRVISQLQLPLYYPPRTGMKMKA